ncbi:MAG: tetratricopeptide repeat protein [Woeseiaceae bacterium]|nr:tetratricopeptide repeat protein [Woeseiaceae bacterium]MDX2608198.1 tetratricopeptide repeat protein [Woeseiaceae bacterium]
MRRLHPRQVTQSILLLVAITTLAACNTTPSKSASSSTQVQVEVEESVGFTLIEDARVQGDVRVDYDRALDLLARGESNEGISLLKTVAAAAPGLSAPRISLAIAHHRLGDLELAEQHLLQALSINPDHPIALNELGIVYRKTARFAAARQQYEAALAVYPGYHYARRNLAVLCDLYLADLECALKNYEAYMATVRSDDEAAMWLKDVRYRAGRTEN